MDISFCFHLSGSLVIAMNFAHGTTAVLSWHVQDYVAIWFPVMELKPNFHQILIMMEKSLVKWACGWHSPSRHLETETLFSLPAAVTHIGTLGPLSCRVCELIILQKFAFLSCEKSNHNFAHAMTIQLSWHVQICELVWLPEPKLEYFFFHKLYVWAHKSLLNTSRAPSILIPHPETHLTSIASGGIYQLWAGPPHGHGLWARIYMWIILFSWFCCGVTSTWSTWMLDDCSHTWR